MNNLIVLVTGQHVAAAALCVELLARYTASDTRLAGPLAGSACGLASHSGPCSVPGLSDTVSG